MLLVVGFHLVEHHCTRRLVFLHQSLTHFIVHFLLLVVQLIKVNLNNKYFTFFCTSCLFESAITCIYFWRIVWFLYSVISLLFCRSNSYLSSPFSKFKKAFAYWAAWPCIKNIRRWSVYFISLANFSFSRYFCFAFSSYFFLYYAIDLALTSSSLFF